MGETPETGPYIDFLEKANGNLVAPLYTPLGGVGLWLDGEPVEFRIVTLEPTSDYDRAHRVDANKRMIWSFVPDGKAHTLECNLVPVCPCEHDWASGERLEAVEFSDEECALIVAVGYDFEAREMGLTDYEAEMTEEGVRVRLFPETAAREFRFGVSWIMGYGEHSRVNPWLLGDPGCN